MVYKSPYSDKAYKERFLSRVDKTSGCWRWKGGILKPYGYGQFWYRGKSIRAHRASWIFFKKNDPGKLCVCHKCDVRDCVNPNHLFLGTRMDNFIDAVKKGRINPRGQTNHAAKLTEDQVKTIREWYGRPLSYEILAQLFNVSKGAIANIVTNREWKHIGG